MATDRAFEDAVHTTLPPLFSNVSSLYGSVPDLEREQSAAPSSWRKNQRNLLTVTALLAKRTQN